MQRRRTLIAAALFAGLTGLACADDGDAPLAPDPARPAIGDWIGQVSWSDAIVTYAWRINPDGTFTSGRAGRGQSGGGAWSADGGHVTLKYDDGFRYEGDLRDDAYSGDAYLSNGRRLGGFLMSRDGKRDADADALADE